MLKKRKDKKYTSNARIFLYAFIPMSAVHEVRSEWGYHTFANDSEAKRVWGAEAPTGERRVREDSQGGKGRRTAREGLTPWLLGLLAQALNTTDPGSSSS